MTLPSPSPPHPSPPSPPQALLHSMHKYYLRLLVEEERRVVAGEERQPARNVLRLDFPETTFVAVTAYQNEEVSCRFLPSGLRIHWTTVHISTVHDFTA